MRRTVSVKKADDNGLVRCAAAPTLTLSLREIDSSCPVRMVTGMSRVAG
jgi:hypothetical protein